VQTEEIIDDIVPRGDKVIIRFKEFSVGPGNYEVPPYTQPYALVVVEKSGEWAKVIKFRFEVEGGIIFAETDHYIPDPSR
jgi:hypothetical protein